MISTSSSINYHSLHKLSYVILLQLITLLHAGRTASVDTGELGRAKATLVDPGRAWATEADPLKQGTEVSEVI